MFHAIISLECKTGLDLFPPPNLFGIRPHGNGVLTLRGVRTAFTSNGWPDPSPRSAAWLPLIIVVLLPLTEGSSVPSVHRQLRVSISDFGLALKQIISTPQRRCVLLQ